MKSYLKSSRFTALLAVGVAACGLLIGAGNASAQTTKTIKGDFNSTDGDSGTYVRTDAVNGDVTTDTVVYTRSSDQETSTDIVTTTKNADKSRAITFSHTDYGSTAQFTSSKTIDKVKGGRTGTGTYTTADGVGGTLTSLDTSAPGATVTNTVYTASTGGVTSDLHVEEASIGFVLIKSISLLPDGTTKATVTTRYVTSVD